MSPAVPGLSGSRQARHTPERTCVGCQQKKAKWELVRIVRSPQGKVHIDPKGRSPGRGVYLCHSPACWELGLKKNRLEHVLKTRLSPESREELLAYWNTLKIAPSAVGSAEQTTRATCLE